MSEKQPEALRLAFIFDDAAEMMEATPDDYFRQTAAELRRQHALLEEMAGALTFMANVCPAIDLVGEEAHERADAVLAKWEASK